VHFSDLRAEPGDEFKERVITLIVTNPHQVTICLPKNASVERIIEVFKKRTGIDGTWEGRVTSDLVPLVVEIVPVVAPTVRCGQSRALAETRVFFRTLEALLDAIITPEEALVQARRNLKLGEEWVLDRSIAQSKKTPRTVIAKWVGEKLIRQPLPDTITSFVATHVDGTLWGQTKQMLITITSLKCERTSGPSHVDDGGGDALQGISFSVGTGVIRYSLSVSAPGWTATMLTPLLEDSG
jgi:hypothetical protein